MSTLFHCAVVRCKLLCQRPVEALLLLLALPLTMYLATTLVSSSLSSEGIPVALIDQDHSEYSKLVIERVSQEPLVQAMLLTEQEATKLIQQGKLEGAFIFKEGFMERLQQGERQQIIEILHAPASLSIGILRELVGREAIRLASNAQAANFVQEQYLQKHLISIEKAPELWQEAWEHSDSYWEPEPLMSINYKEFPLFSAAQPTANQNEAGLADKVVDVSGEDSAIEREQLTMLIGWLAALLMLLAIFLQHWLVEEKEQGLLPRVKGFSTKPALYLLGHSLPIFLLLVLELGLSLAIIHGQLAAGRDYASSILTNGTLVSLLLVYTLFCFSFAFCLALWVRTSAQLQGVGMAITLLTSIFGGAFVSLAEWTSTLQLLARFTPQDWLLSGVRVSLSGATTMLQVWQPVAVLSVLALLSICAAIWRWNKQ